MHNVTVTAGPAGERFTISTSAALAAVGPSITELPARTLHGHCRTRPAVGFSETTRVLMLELGPGETTWFQLRQSLRRPPRSPGEVGVVLGVADEPLPDGAPGTATRRMVRSEPPALAMPLGVALRIDSIAPVRGGAFLRGQPVRVKGRAPALPAGQRLELQAFPPGEHCCSRVVAVARVRARTL